jgi:hypothetical protein
MTPQLTARPWEARRLQTRFISAGARSVFPQSGAPTRGHRSRAASRTQPLDELPYPAAFLCDPSPGGRL